MRSITDNIESIRQELANDFVKDLLSIKQLALESADKDDFIMKLRYNNLITTTSYYYIKDEEFENIESKINKLIN